MKKLINIKNVCYYNLYIVKVIFIYKKIIDNLFFNSILYYMINCLKRL